MNKNIIIRKVKVEDAKKFLKHINMVWRMSYKNIFPEEVFLDRESKITEKIKDFDKDYYNDNETFTYVAEFNTNIIGIAWGKINSEYLYFKDKGFADLMAIYINPDFQGFGIGTKFKEIFVDWAKKNGAKNFVIGVLKDNIKARKVYEKWGGRLSAHSESFIRLGKGYEEVFYEYNL